MPYTPDHSGNFPSEFYPCPECEKLGMYQARPTYIRGKLVPGYMRCKYCGLFLEGYEPRHLPGAEVPR